MPSRQPWSDRELESLAQLAETIVRGGSVRRAGLASEALTRSADPSQVRQLRLVLRLVQSRLVNLLLMGKAASFRDLSPADRERCLLGWAHSRIPLRRSAFQAFGRLLAFIAYADPGSAIMPNPRHAAVGYRPEHPPLTMERTTIRPVAFDPGEGPVTLEADVVVVGSGAGGGVIAAELTRVGRSVVVVE